MIDTILTLPLELMTLTLLVGLGMLYSYHTRHSATNTTSASRPYDMRGEVISASPLSATRLIVSPRRRVPAH